MHPVILNSMSQAAINLGTTVKVTRVREHIPQDLLNKLKANSIGEVTGFQVTDGSGIGPVVTFPDGSSCWFFDDEVSPI